MRTADVLVVGGGIAGLSVAARLAGQARVVVVEGESAPGYHASGRSVAFAHYGLGNEPVRALTALSMAELAEHGSVHPALHIASIGEIAALDALEDVHREYGCDFARIGCDEARALMPALRPEACVAALVDHGSLKLDTNAMLQAHAASLKAAGGTLVTGARVHAIAREGDGWRVATAAGDVAAPILVNAAGAWADVIAQMAGVTPIGLQPRRRTVISFAAPEGEDVRTWPFTKTVGEGFYLLPEGRGQLLASSMDQTPSEPCDAAAEELDIAIAADRVEQATTLPIRRISHSWAGLRSFAPDELPVIGEAAGAPGFIWCAGQGGAGFQTAPALSAIAAAATLGLPFPDDCLRAGLTPETFAPARLGA
ncbi:NAD(P)/FAD-dependent oxidoreductase [Porphyrobacter sp. ULC335]|uniref:NAD(P)/FAD-dependent oxidoreductase n=1 Tax=Porphyrobacter sp. ULC335 TaxID=2854260 RepID=UPI002220623B|nr:FAD-dependent oxidoreductase [Porphyrobacter sp. ULC335]UYV14571.1 FAD-binding oxidoreductase [Porphyrobacter sp. ULC335]